MTPKEYIESRLEASLLVKRNIIQLMDYYVYAPDGKNNFSIMCLDVEGQKKIRCLMLYPSAYCNMYEVFYYDLTKNLASEMQYVFKCKIDAAFANIAKK